MMRRHGGGSRFATLRKTRELRQLLHRRHQPHQAGANMRELGRKQCQQRQHEVEEHFRDEVPVPITSQTLGTTANNWKASQMRIVNTATDRNYERAARYLEETPENAGYRPNVRSCVRTVTQPDGRRRGCRATIDARTGQ